MAVFFGPNNFSHSWIALDPNSGYKSRCYWFTFEKHCVLCYARKVAISWADLHIFFLKSLQFLTGRKSFKCKDGDNMLVRQACINPQTYTTVKPRRPALEQRPP